MHELEPSTSANSNLSPVTSPFSAVTRPSDEVCRLGWRELVAVLEVYRGDLPTAAARCYFSDRVVDGDWITMIFPREVRAKYGIEGYNFASRDILLTYAEDTDFQAEVELLRTYAAMLPERGPRPAAYSMTLGIKQMSDVVAASPHLPCENGIQVLRYREDALGWMYDLAGSTAIEFPKDLGLPNPEGWDSLFIKFADLLHTMLPHVRKDDPIIAPVLEEIANRYYLIDADIQILPPGQPHFQIYELRWEEEARREEIVGMGCRLYGSVRLPVWGQEDVAAYSTDDQEHPYRIYALLDEDSFACIYLVSADHIVTGEIGSPTLNTAVLQLSPVDLMDTPSSSEVGKTEAVCE